MGRGRPPEQTRFRPDDGRPRGRRPKGAKNEKSDWEEELAETVDVTVNGKSRKLAKRRLLIKTTLSAGIKGDARAGDLVFKRIDRHGIGEERAHGAGISSSDEEILRAFYVRMKQLEDGGNDVES